jgi:hypothetical protein
MTRHDIFAFRLCLSSLKFTNPFILALLLSIKFDSTRPMSNEHLCVRNIYVDPSKALCPECEALLCAGTKDNGINCITGTSVSRYVKSWRRAFVPQLLDLNTRGLQSLGALIISRRSGWTAMLSPSSNFRLWFGMCLQWLALALAYNSS